jgi:DMSO reductase family type II enzyme heme b subunit
MDMRQTYTVNSATMRQTMNRNKMGHKWRPALPTSLIALGFLMVGLGFSSPALAQEAEGFITQKLPAPFPAEQIEAGKRVYFTKCVWCHGVNGSGDGPGADRLWPRPRNFNSGTFKIRHTASGELPLVDVDLLQTVTHGLPGSAMPSWEGILSEDQRRDVLAFVTSELVVDRSWQDEEFEELHVLELDKLAAAAVPNSAESIKRGSELVIENKCIECHGVEGRGDGNAFNLKDDWGFSIQPADWHKCWNFRGSRQDAYNVNNIFRTFSTGINGTPMPSFADNITVEDRWHIANYVASLCERDKDVDIAGGNVTDEIAANLFAANPRGIDPMTDKPKVNFVIPSKFAEGELPKDEHDPRWYDERWKKEGRRLVAMGGQITHKPRNFVSRIDDMWVQSLYNETHVTIMFRWDDRTKSVQQDEVDWDPYEVNLKDYGIVEQEPGGSQFDDDGTHPDSIASKQNSYQVFNDGLAFQMPIKFQELPAPRKPRYFWGDEGFPVDIAKWTADGNLLAYEGTGWDQDLEDRDDFTEQLKLEKAEWKDGRWTVIISRPLKADYEADTYIELGKYIPINFFVWDGHNGDVGRKMSVSAFYYLVLEPPVPSEAKWYAGLAAVGLVIVEGWVLTRRSNRRKELGTK